MRRSIFALSILASSFALVACEDGPNQTFSPPPANAADNYNNGNTPPAFDNGAHQGFVQDGGAGANKQELCPGDVKAKKWAQMVTKPIVPPRKGAGIDMAGQAWAGITVEQAEDPAQGGNCQSDVYFDNGSSVYNSWGDTQDVVFAYRVSNRKIFYMAFQNGYVGTVEADSRDKAHHYSLGLPNSSTGGRILVDNQPITLDWTQDGNGDRSALEAKVAPLVDALFATFAPGLPPEPNCFATSHCKSATFSDDSGYVFIPALGFAFRVQSVVAADPVPSTLVYFDQYLEKVLPFSYADTMLKLDSEGPLAVAKGLGTGKDCTLRMTSSAAKLTYADFLSNCVQVTSDQNANAEEMNKLLGGLTHGTERFSFDVSGVDINFSDKTLDPHKVVGDKDLPTPDDESTTFDVDQSTLGRIANDYANNDITQAHDLHGAGMVYLEYARLVQDYLQKYRPLGVPLRKLGDPACLYPNLKLKSDGTPDGPIPVGCTGFEGFMTTAPKAAVTDPQMAALASPGGRVGATLSLGLKPGSPKALFCLRPDVASGCTSGPLFDGSYQKVISIFGAGAVKNLPIEVQDRRFFFKMYAKAIFKYLRNAGNLALTSDQLHAQPLDPNDVFFDSVGSGQFEIAEYVERGAVNGDQPPTDISITADILNGIFNDYAFSRYLYRGEKALYQAIHCTSTDPKACAPGDQGADLGEEENRALLSNIFGSPILASAYADSDSKTAYQCATADPKSTTNPLDPDDLPGGKGGACARQLPPMDVDKTTTCAKSTDCGADHPLCYLGSCADIQRDEAGRPFLAGYPGAIGAKSTVFSLGASPVKVTQTLESIESAVMKVQFHADPYDSTSDYVMPATEVLVPWLPKQPGVGFPVAISGTRDKFINTYQLDLSGTTISANVDYDLDPTSGQVIFKAVETTDFLGDVFVCQDTLSKDILTARMYTAVASILDWFSAHPSAYNDCQMIIRYSPYNNYADYITSLKSGVRLGITQGGGYGRVNDVVLFTPGVQ